MRSNRPTPPSYKFVPIRDYLFIAFDPINVCSGKSVVKEPATETVLLAFSCNLTLHDESADTLSLSYLLLAEDYDLLPVGCFLRFSSSRRKKF
jgi:hypothetical protein